MPAPKKRPAKSRKPAKAAGKARPRTKARKAGLPATAAQSLVVLLEGAPFHVAAIRKRAKELGLPTPVLDGDPSWEVDLEVVGDTEMARLNGMYREKPKTTDVLSFPAAGIFRTRGMLGAIVICSAQLRRQAKELGHSELDELRVLLVHGFCHLLDWDHELGATQTRAMARVERAVLDACFPDSARRVRGLIERAEKAQSSGVSQRRK